MIIIIIIRPYRTRYSIRTLLRA